MKQGGAMIRISKEKEGSILRMKRTISLTKELRDEGSHGNDKHAVLNPNVVRRHRNLCSDTVIAKTLNDG